MNQIYVTYKCQLFLFNVQQRSEYKCMVLTDKAELHQFVAVLMSLLYKTGYLQIKKCILSFILMKNMISQLK